MGRGEEYIALRLQYDSRWMGDFCGNGMASEVTAYGQQEYLPYTMRGFGKDVSV